MNDKQKVKLVSPQKLTANRTNAQRSTGPRTSAGKQRSAQNAYKHGFYALRLFPTKELVAKDGGDYQRILDVYRTHYAPVGDLENLYVEKIAVECLRLARLLGHEQNVFRWRQDPFEATSINKIVRYESNLNRQLGKAVQELERLQEIRKAQSNQFETSELSAADATEEPPEALEEVAVEPAPHVDALPLAPQCVETSAKQELAHTDGEPSVKPAEAAASPSPPTESGTSKTGVTSAIEPAVEHEPIGSSRWIETSEDAKLCQSLLEELSLEAEDHPKVPTEEELEEMPTPLPDWNEMTSSSNVDSISWDDIPLDL